ncbi:MAG: hypothetical protein ACMUEM_04285 [Flavobacteriales bacterium AspAUS03]
MDLTNLGMNFYLDFIEQRVESGKSFFILGLNLEENLELLHKVRACPSITSIELNLSCLNIPDNSNGL